MNNKRYVSEPIFVADIGGTNANFGIVVRQDGRYRLIASYRLPSQQISNFTRTLRDLLEKIAEEHHMRFSAMVIGVAGPLCGKVHVARLTNLPFALDSADIKRETGLEVLFINDFLSFSCWYYLVEDTVPLTQLPARSYEQLAFIGAGTGLGQSSAVWSPSHQIYIPLESEGGHTEAVPHDVFDQGFFSFLQSRALQTLAVSWEQLLSGKGISLLYEFLGTQKHYPETTISVEIATSKFQPDFISRYAESDERCKQTFNRYLLYYAHFAKQVALQVVPCGGLYIAGGIAARNKKLFILPEFLRTFTNHARHRKLLESIPIFLIQDYQVSLYGGAHYYTLHTLGLL